MAYGAVRDAAISALRALQKADQIAPTISPNDTPDQLHRQTLARRYLIMAETRLGELIGLTCTGEYENEGYYNHGHGSTTCPVHEWFVESDCEDIEEELAR